MSHKASIIGSLNYRIVFGFGVAMLLAVLASNDQVLQAMPFDERARVEPIDAFASSAACQSAWEVVPSPNVDSDPNFLNGVAGISADDVWAVGEFDEYDPGLHTQPLIEHWNGKRWRIVPGPMGYGEYSGLNAVATVSANNAWAVGYSSQGGLILHWDGASWNVVPSPHPGNIEGLYGIVAFSANDVWAVGRYSWNPWQPRALILHWDGSGWRSMPPPTGDTNAWLAGVAGVSAKDIWAVGGGPIMHWDGAAWSMTPSEGLLRGIAAVSANNVWAVGENYSTVLIKRWNGHAWSVESTPKFGKSSDTTLYAATAVSRNDVLAVGEEWIYIPDIPGWGSRTLILERTAIGWRRVLSPNVGNEYNGLFGITAVPHDGIWAVGSYANFQESDRTLILHRRWPPLPPNISGLVSPSYDAMMNQPAVQLSWRCANHADWYDVIVRRGSTTGPIADEQSNLTTTQYATRSLGRGQVYYWRVQACNTTGCQPSLWRRFWVLPKN